MLAGIVLGTPPPNLFGTDFFASLISEVGNDVGAHAGSNVGMPVRRLDDAPAGLRDCGKLLGRFMDAPAGLGPRKLLGRLLGRLPAAEREAKILAAEAGTLDGRARWVSAAALVGAARDLVSSRLTIEAGTPEGVGPLGRLIGAPAGRVPVGKKVAIDSGTFVGMALLLFPRSGNAPLGAPEGMDVRLLKGWPVAKTVGIDWGR